MSRTVTLHSYFREFAIAKEMPPFDPNVGCYMVPHYELELEGWKDLVNEIVKTYKSLSMGTHTALGHDFFVTIDQSSLKSGETHRRPGPHYDGYWMNSCRPDPRWNTVDHSLVNKSDIILLSNVMGSVGYRGKVKTYLTEGGDCSHLAEELKSFTREPLEANKIYLGSSHFIHESVPVEKDCDRQLLRITVCRSPR